MKIFFQKHKLILTFLLRAAGIYLAWSLLYNIWLYENKSVDTFLIHHLISTTSFLLNAMGYSIFILPDLIGITNSSGLIISPPCDGLSLFILFAGFIIAFPGNVKSKLVFIPIGLLIIDIINIFRIVSLVIIVKYSPQSLEFNHSYTFTLIMYVVIFFMWMFWIKKSSPYLSEKNAEIIDTKKE